MKKKEKGQIKKGEKGQIKKGKAQKKKKKEKKIKGTMLLSFSALVLQSSTMFFIERVPYAFTFIY